ncbi:MAG TPA: DUF3592 domain-containing protein [Thermoanaerobaculia bacterium]|nr:DUF3592 domain-containing protein [Thermoanaerobaculia bacterium]
MPTTPLSQRSSAAPAKGCLAFFFLVFFLAGAAGSYFVLWKPLSRLFASRSWTETQCDVLSSQVTEVPSSDSSTYKVDIRYTWTAGGSTRVGSRYDFMAGSSSGREGKQRIVDRYPPGARVTCWVDPDDPNEAVLYRGLSPVYLIGLLPLAFLVIGLGGLVWTLRPGRRGTGTAPAAAAGVSPFGVPLPPAGGGPAELKPAATPLGMFLGLVFLALFWNGIVAVFVWQMALGWKEHRPDGCLTAFLVPFILVGLALIFGVVRQFLVLFNPRLSITMTPGVLTPGQTAFVQWRLGSGGRGVSRVLITFEGREEARYRRGTSTYTDRETFLTLPVVDCAQSDEISEGGSASFTVPPGTVPSFRSAHNQIIWTLKAKCELPRWPDTEEEYEVVVQPGGAA